MKLLATALCLVNCFASTSFLSAHMYDDLAFTRGKKFLKSAQSHTKVKNLKTKKKLKSRNPLKGINGILGFDDPSNMTFLLNYIKAAVRYVFDKASTADKVKYFTSKTAGKLKDPNGKTKNKINQVTANFMPLMQLGNYSKEFLSFMGVTYDPKKPSKPTTFPNPQVIKYSVFPAYSLGSIASFAGTAQTNANLTTYTYTTPKAASGQIMVSGLLGAGYILGLPSYTDNVDIAPYIVALTGSPLTNGSTYNIVATVDSNNQTNGQSNFTLFTINGQSIDPQKKILQGTPFVVF